MTARRRLLAAASATFALAALTGCEKPAPIVTVVSGGESVHTEAAIFCFDESDTIESDSCSQRATEPTRLAVRGGDRIGIDVDKEVVERGWVLELTDPENPQGNQSSDLISKHYFPFTAPGIPSEKVLLLTVRAVGEDGFTGEWHFELVGRD
jgi:hypothetical protein